MKARAMKVAHRRRALRAMRTEPASEALREFGRGVCLDVLTYGQFSIIDALVALLEITGPAAVKIATWTAEEFDLSMIARQLEASKMTSLNLLVDRSFVTRRPEFLAFVQHMLNGGVAVCKLHAKWMTIRNEEWNVCVRTSMNLNYNARMEFVQVSDDAELADFYDYAFANPFERVEVKNLAPQKNQWIAAKSISVGRAQVGP